MHTIAEKKLLMLRPSEIKSERGSRKYFDPYELKMLSDSIASSGIIQPISVRKSEDGGYYELIAGERRLKAAIMAGLRRVPCILHKTDDETAAFFSVTENLQRSNLGFFEEAEIIYDMINRFGLSQTETAARLGIAQSTLSNKLRLLRLDEALRERITVCGLTERHARTLLRLPQNQREDALDRIVSEDMTLRQTEDLIDGMLNPRTDTADVKEIAEENCEPVRKIAIGDVRLFTNSLSKLVCTLQNAGIKACSHKYETDKYIEYKVRISKNVIETGQYKQLKIC